MNKLEISWGSLWRIVFIFVFAAALFLAKEALAALFLAIIISSALDAPVNFLERKKIPRILGTLFIFIMTLAFLAFILYTIIPVAISEFQILLTNVSKLEMPVFGSLDVSYFNEIGKYLGNLANALFSGGISSLLTLVKRI